ncbi:MAG: hypothetical protein J6M05_04955 [Cardiobacteriaceae bacterium]|nr:hypothetical protein [Cardiobacteriaceae bacterium]
MCQSECLLSTARQVLDAKTTSNRYYLFPDKLIICGKNNDIIKIINPPSDDKTFVKHMLVTFEQMYYERDYLVVVVSTRLWDCWFKMYDNTLELSEDYNFWKM